MKVINSTNKMKNNKIKVIRYIGDALFILTAILFTENILSLNVSLILFDISLLCIWYGCYNFIMSKKNKDDDIYLFWMVKLVGLTLSFITANIIAVIMVIKKII